MKILIILVIIIAVISIAAIRIRCINWQNDEMGTRA